MCPVAMMGCLGGPTYRNILTHVIGKRIKLLANRIARSIRMMGMNFINPSGYGSLYILVWVHNLHMQIFSYCKFTPAPLRIWNFKVVLEGCSKVAR